MNNIKILPIRDIVKLYDVLIFDVWGVVHDGIAPYPGSIKFINEMIDDNKIVIFLSNNPRPGYLMNKQFSEFGLNMHKAITFTSGDAVREQLTLWNDEVFSTLGKKVYHIGAENNQDILSGISVNITNDITQADFLLITAFIDSNQNLDLYDELLKKAVELNIPAVCANPDITAYSGHQIRYCAGNFAKQYESFGGKVHYYGKPDSKIYNTLISKYLFGYDRKKMLMIGDTMETDILGANKMNIDSALALTGNGEKIGNQLLNGNVNVFENSVAKPTWVTYGIKG